MRTFLALLSLLVYFSSLAACSMGGTACNTAPAAEPVMEIKSPVWFRKQPVLQPQGYAIATQAPVQAPPPAVLTPVPYIYAPAVQPQAVGPCGGGGPAYDPPPVPPPSNPDDPPESIPALKKAK